MRGRELETEAREGTGRNDDGGDGGKRLRVRTCVSLIT